jgi:hypothetical protein
MTKLKSAWRVHLNSVRRRFFDHIDDSAVEHVAGALTRWPLNSRTAPRSERA